MRLRFLGTRGEIERRSPRGSEIVRDERRTAARVEALGAERGVHASIAHDVLELRL